MPEEEDYAIVPAKRMQELQEQLNELKRNPLGSLPAGTDVVSSMNKLSRTMEEMLSLVRDAASQMQLEERESQSLGKKLDPVVEKLDTLLDQNNKIAKGVLALADMIKEMKHQRHPMPPPRISIFPSQPPVTQRPAEDIFGNLPPTMMGPSSSPSFAGPPAAGPIFPSLGMTAGPPRQLPPAPSPPGFMNKKREAPF